MGQSVGRYTALGFEGFGEGAAASEAGVDLAPPPSVRQIVAAPKREAEAYVCTLHKPSAEHAARWLASGGA